MAKLTSIFSTHFVTPRKNKLNIIEIFSDKNKLKIWKGLKCVLDLLKGGEHVLSKTAKIFGGVLDQHNNSTLQTNLSCFYIFFILLFRPCFNILLVIVATN